MTVAIERDPIYRGRRFQSEIIELCVRWYLTYRLSYRDLVEMLAERGVVISHTTIYRMKATLGKNMPSCGECAIGRFRSIRDRSVRQEGRWLGFEVAGPCAREVASWLTFWTALSVRNRWSPVILAVQLRDKRGISPS